MSINSAFLEYFQTTFFANNPEEFEAFRKSLLRPLKKTLRINRNKRDIAEFIEEKTKEWWVFSPTPNWHVFHVDRDDTSIPLGSTPEHLRGDFYIQELSASMSVWHLSEWRIHSEPLRILEMAASPGGKTTQLAEHYPNSYIVANEFSRERMSSLLENIERMGLSRIAVTNMNGIQFRDLENSFDLVLLDAPCSWEGIGFKAAESLRYWNIKNVRTIARLQKKLLRSGIASLKPGGTLLYSTCTLNRMENEEVLEDAREAFGDSIEVEFSKRFWPHLEIAGGFFVAKIRKLSTHWEGADNTWNDESKNNDISPLTGSDLWILERALHDLWTKIDANAACWYRYKNDILYLGSISENQDTAAEMSYLNKLYAIRFGQRIGRIEHGNFEPDPSFGVHFTHSNLPAIDIGKDQLAPFMRWMSVNTEKSPTDGLVQVYWNHRPLGFATIKGTEGVANLPKHMFWK